VSRSCSRVWATLDQAISDWPRTARRIAAALEIDWTETCEGATREASLFIKPRLCHPTHQSRTRPDESGWFVSRVWSAVQHGISGDDAGAQARFDELRLILQDIDRLQNLSRISAWPLERLKRTQEATLAAMYDSTSWRLTSPLRTLKRFLQQLRIPRQPPRLSGS
jgi:hypothetical protein